LKSVYYHFEIKPYSKGIARSIKKEGKYYLYDWTQVENEGARFENLMALHLMKLVTYYNDTGQANLDLFYLKNKSKQEVDFLVTQKNNPLFSVEVKLNELNLDKTFQVFQKKVKFPHFQVCLKNKVFREFKQEGAHSAYVISASNFLKFLP
jgi:predicted AAA+ superfamily ATPase